MKKYIVLALIPILLQGALLQSSEEEEFHRAIQPSLQIAQTLLEKSTIPAESEKVTIKPELELVLIRLIKSVQNKSIPKKDALDTILAIKKALLEYRNKQYTSTWQWLISPTPEIVKTKVKPALYQVNTALSTLNQSILNSYTVAAAIIAIIMAGSIIVSPEHYKAYQIAFSKGYNAGCNSNINCKTVREAWLGTVEEIKNRKS